MIRDVMAAESQNRLPRARDLPEILLRPEDEIRPEEDVDTQLMIDIASSVRTAISIVVPADMQTDSVLGCVVNSPLLAAKVGRQVVYNTVIYELIKNFIRERFRPTSQGAPNAKLNPSQGIRNAINDLLRVSNPTRVLGALAFLEESFGKLFNTMDFARGMNLTDEFILGQLKPVAHRLYRTVLWEAGKIAAKPDATKDKALAALKTDADYASQQVRNDPALKTQIDSVSNEAKTWIYAHLPEKPWPSRERTPRLPSAPVNGRPPERK